MPKRPEIKSILIIDQAQLLGKPVNLTTQEPKLYGPLEKTELKLF